MFSPDGKSLAIVSSRKNLEESNIWTVPVDGSAASIYQELPNPGMESLANGLGQPRIYFHRNSPTELTDLLVSDLNGTSKYLTHTTPKNFESGLVTPETVHFKAKTAW